MATTVYDINSKMNVSGTVDIGTEIITIINHVHVKVNGNISSLTASGLADLEGCILFLMVQQDATGGHTITFDTAVFELAGGVQPTLTTTANAMDTFIFGVMNAKLHQHGIINDVK